MTPPFIFGENPRWPYRKNLVVPLDLAYSGMFQIIVMSHREAIDRSKNSNSAWNPFKFHLKLGGISVLGNTLNMNMSFPVFP